MIKSSLKLIWFLLAGLLFLDGASDHLRAQYFGRNEVKYGNFHFKALNTEHFDIYYYPTELAAAEDGARMAERWYNRLSEIFNYSLNQTQPVILYANHADFQQTNVVSGMISQGTGGVT